jgi:hypothetical protein
MVVGMVGQEGDALSESPIPANQTPKEGKMTDIVKVVEVLAQSEKSWEDAAKVALKETAKTIKGIESIYLKEFQAIVEDDEITQYRVTAKVSFKVKDKKRDTE